MSCTCTVTFKLQMITNSDLFSNVSSLKWYRKKIVQHLKGSKFVINFKENI